jgi:phosphoglycolate phosphatase-like HAD superfamily hydrolase
MMIRLALFDLDSTLNSGDRRKDFIPTDTRINANWLDWHKAFRMERLNHNLITTAAGYAAAGYKIGVVSNRDNSLIQDTRVYLGNSGFPEAQFFLRSGDDNRRTKAWKLDTFNSILAFIGPAEVHIFDDDGPMLDALSERYRYSKDVQLITHQNRFTSK